LVGSQHHGPGKKLEQAAAYFARGGPELDKAREDLRQFGATEEEIDRQLGPEEDAFSVWPENWEALNAFLLMNTQWVVGMNGPTGLDYTRVKDGLSMAGVEMNPELFSKLRTLETAALNTWAKKGR